MKKIFFLILTAMADCSTNQVHLGVESAGRRYEQIGVIRYQDMIWRGKTGLEQLAISSRQNCAINISIRKKAKVDSFVTCVVRNGTISFLHSYITNTSSGLSRYAASVIHAALQPDKYTVVWEVVDNLSSSTVRRKNLK